VLTLLREKFIPRDQARHLKSLVVHTNDCLIHTNGATQRFTSEHQMSRMPQHPYSQDFTSSDFYSFPTVKNRVEKIPTVDEDNLFEQLLEILKAIPVDELERVFTAWVDRVREVSQGNGD
jgi:hypothetical protein